MNPLNTRTLLVAGGAVWLLLLTAGCHMGENSTADTASPGTTNSPVGAGSDNTLTNAVAADNSQVNTRDRNGANLTAVDQSNSPSDVDLTRQIRKSVVNSTNNFSFAAQNIKIITINGKVTLRGPVATDAEKTSIGEIARNAAGEGNVDNQLEPKNSQ